MTPRAPAAKVQPFAELTGIVKGARALGRRVVHARGVFDLLSHAHIQRLDMARHQGDLLVVTIRDDGQTTDPAPLLDARLRAEVLARLPCVDYVAVETGLSQLQVSE